MATLKAAHLAELYAKLRSEKIRYVKGEKVRFGRPLGANSVLRIHRLLYRMFGWAERLGLVQHNVARLVQALKAAPSPARALTTAQVERVLVAAEGTDLWRFFVVAAKTGMRRGESGALTWHSIDFERGTVSVRQGGGEYRKGGALIKSTKSARGFVFADHTGGLLDLDGVSKSFSAILRDLGIKAKGLSIRSLRHFVGAMGLATGNHARFFAARRGRLLNGLSG